MVIYIGDTGLVPFTAVGEVVDNATPDTALVFWNREYFTEVPLADLLPA